MKRVDTLKTTDQIIIASLLAALPTGQQNFTINQHWASDFTPTIDFSTRLLIHLANEHAISIDQPQLMPHTSFQLNIENSDINLSNLIQSIKNSPKEYTNELHLLIHDLIASECMDFLSQQLKKQNLHLNLSKKPPQELYELLKLNSCSEVHMLIWLSLKTLSNSDLRIFKASSVTSNIASPIITKAMQLSCSYRENKKNISPFRKLQGFRQTALNNILFTQYLECGTDYYTTHWPIWSKSE